MKKILIIASLEKNFPYSGVGKYILGYLDLFQESYAVSYLFQPADHGIVRGYLRRIFILPHILKKTYKNHIKIFYDENFLISWRGRMKKSSIMIVHHYPYLVKSKSFMENMMKPIHYFTFNYILPHIRYVVSVSEFTSEILLRHVHINKENLTCIENSIDENIYTPIQQIDISHQRDNLTKKFGLPSGLLLLSVAVAEYRKNIPTLIKLLNILPDKYYLLRVGKHLPGTQEREISSLVKDYNLQKRYIHLTQVNETDLIALYQSATVFLFPSLFEGFGRPPLEAQACGCPVIATRCGSLAETLRDSAYFIDDPFNIESWKHAIQEIQLDNIKDVFAKKGIDNAKRYTTSKLYKKRKEILHTISL